MFEIDVINVYFCLGGFVLGSFVFIIYSLKLRKEIKVLKRQYEKKSIGMDDSSLKVKTLENKIKTLEVALKKKLDE